MRDVPLSLAHLDSAESLVPARVSLEMNRESVTVVSVGRSESETSKCGTYLCAGVMPFGLS